VDGGQERRRKTDGDDDEVIGGDEEDSEFWVLCTCVLFVRETQGLIEKRGKY
jgi:hypothetical protein